jgi:hypothetical protein
MRHPTKSWRRPSIAALPTIGDLVVAALFLAFTRSSVQAWAAHGDLAALLLAVQELLIGVLALCRRRARPTPAAQPVWAAVLAWLGTLLPLALRPVAPAVALLDQHVGLALQLWGGLVMVGATLALAEERLLAQDAAYQTYQARVRYPLLPGVW